MELEFMKGLRCFCVCVFAMCAGCSGMSEHDLHVQAMSYNPINWSPPGSSVHGILRARRLEWVAVSFSLGSSQPRKITWVSFIADRHTLY